jgi:hypothetical protein
MPKYTLNVIYQIKRNSINQYLNLTKMNILSDVRVGGTLG